MTYLDDKLKPIGEFNSSIDALERATESFEELWNDGKIRLSVDDIQEIEAKLRMTKGFLGRIKNVVELFNGITNNKIEKTKE